MGQTVMRFLLDSGAAVSVVRCDTLADCWGKDIVPFTGEQNTVAADCLPLDVIRKVVLPVSLGQLASSPGSLSLWGAGKKREPGIHCLRMLENYPDFG